jgi:DNA polymerase V
VTETDSLAYGRFGVSTHGPRRAALMSTLSRLNLRYGRGTVLMASAGLAGDERAWSMKQEQRTLG